MERIYDAKECNYFQPEECKIDKSLVERVGYYLLHKKKIKNSINSDEIKIMRDIQDLATVAKHIAYISEKEWRFICKTSSIPKHIMSKGIIKPYIEFSIPIEAITSITIGPCIKDGYDIISITRFIKETLRANTEIRYSKIPYRR